MRENLTYLPITALEAIDDVLFVASGNWLLLRRKSDFQLISKARFLDIEFLLILLKFYFF